MFPRSLFIMLACAGLGYFLGRTRGMGLQGFFFGLAFGPLGWALILLWPRSWVQGPMPRSFEGPDPASGPASREGESAREFRPAPPERAGGGPFCPRCGRPVEREAGSCPHCGNVLVPIRYAVEDRESSGS